MSTIRIDIDGQARGQCLFFNVSDITIDRRLPGALNSHMSASVWTQFCDKIDEALTSIGEIKRNLQKNAIIFAAVYILLCVAFFILTMVDTNISLIFWLLIGSAIGSVMVMVFCIKSQRVRAQLQEVEEDVKKLCITEGDKMPGVSFHLREEEHLRYSSGSTDGSVVAGMYVSHVTQYIECSVSASPSMMELGSLATPVAMAAPEVFTTKMSAAERLSGLEDIKGMLTEKEYNSKRRAILREM
jgi:hypothetical protein